MRTLKGLDGLLTGLDGVPLREVDGAGVTIGSILANCLARGSSEEPARAMAVALRIHGGGDEVEIEDADFALVQQAVNEDKMMNNMAKAAALNVLE